MLIIMAVGRAYSKQHVEASRQGQSVSRMHRKVRCHTSLIPMQALKQRGLVLLFAHTQVFMESEYFT